MPADPARPDLAPTPRMVGFGGGCHWCTEAVFQPLIGVLAVRQGHIAAAPPDDAWSEAVEVDFDPLRIGLGDLIGVHLGTHSSSAQHALRGKYRSAVYATGDEDLAEAAALIAALSVETGLSFVTRALRHRGFRPSAPRHQEYYRKGRERPFCRTHIEPKLAYLRARHGALLATDPGMP